MKLTRTTLATAALALAAGGCAGDDADPTATTAVSTPATPSTSEPSASSTAPATADVPSTTARPETTMTTTTVAPIAALTIEKVAEYPDRQLRQPFTDGASAVVLSSFRRPDGLPSGLWVRLDANGQIVQEGPVEGIVGGSSTAAAIEAAGRRFLFGWYNTPDGFKAGCGLRELDPPSLTMSPQILSSVDGTCFGELAVSDTEPSVVWLPGQQSVNWIDTATGATGSIPIAWIDVERQTLTSIQVVGGIPYVGVGVFTDTATGDLMTAADGSPLSPLVVRIDPPTGATAAAAIAGSELRLVDGLLNVWTPDAAQVIDPTTLATTDVDPRDLMQRPGDAREIWFSDVWDGDSYVVRADQTDPVTGTVLSEGSLDTGSGQNTGFDGVWVGEDLLILAIRPVTDPATGMTTFTTDVYAVRQP